MKERNYNIDILKLLCAILVVMLHTSFVWHDFLLPITRCAVPCFFMISGFLIYNGKGIAKESIIKRIKHIFHITLWATILYICWSELLSILNGEGLFLPSIRQWVEYIVLNQNPFGFHLWYLGAYLYVSIIMLFVNSEERLKILILLTPVLLLVDLMFGKYSLLLFNREFPYILVRNFLFVGIPYFTIGIILKKYCNVMLSVNRVYYLGGVILFSLTSILEKFFLISLDKNPMRDHYISTTLLAISLMAFVLSFENRASAITRIGERNTLYIYIFHPLFITILPVLLESFPIGLTCIYFYIAPAIVFLAALVLTVILRVLKIIK